MMHYQTNPSSTGNTQHVTVKGSIREKLPPSLSIKSVNLRVLDPIGQGSYRYLQFSITISYNIIFSGEFGIVYKGCLASQYIDEIVAIKTLKGIQLL